MKLSQTLFDSTSYYLILSFHLWLNSRLSVANAYGPVYCKKKVMDADSGTTILYTIYTILDVCIGKCNHKF